MGALSCGQRDVDVDDVRMRGLPSVAPISFARSVVSSSMITGLSRPADADLLGHTLSHTSGQSDHAAPRGGIWLSTQRTASLTAVTDSAAAAGGRLTMTTGMPRSLAASSLPAVSGPPLFFVTSTSMP
jgi:hypothetical protein